MYSSMYNRESMTQVSFTNKYEMALLNSKFKSLMKKAYDLLIPDVSSDSSSSSSKRK